MRPLSCHVTSLPWQEPEEELAKYLPARYTASTYCFWWRLCICLHKMWKPIDQKSVQLVVGREKWLVTSDPESCFCTFFISLAIAIDISSVTDTEQFLVKVHFQNLSFKIMG